MATPESSSGNPVEPHTLEEWTAMRFNSAAECFGLFNHRSSHGFPDADDGLPAFCNRDEKDPELVWINNVNGYPKYPDGSNRMYLTERTGDGELKLTSTFACTLPRTGFAQ